MDHQQILELIKAVGKAGLTNFEYSEGNLHISMSAGISMHTGVSEGYTGSQTPGQIPNEIAEEEPGENIVRSPLVGTFYAASSDEAEPFVKVGDLVKKGQTLAIVEAMKLMNEIESEYDGIVTEICVTNEDSVEYGQPLFRIQTKNGKAVRSI